MVVLELPAAADGHEGGIGEVGAGDRDADGAVNNTALAIIEFDGEGLNLRFIFCQVLHSTGCHTVVPSDGTAGAIHITGLHRHRRGQGAKGTLRGGDHRLNAMGVSQIDIAKTDHAGVGETARRYDQFGDSSCDISCGYNRNIVCAGDRHAGARNAARRRQARHGRCARVGEAVRRAGRALQGREVMHGVERLGLVAARVGRIGHRVGAGHEQFPGDRTGAVGSVGNSDRVPVSWPATIGSPASEAGGAVHQRRHCAVFDRAEDDLSAVAA